MQLASSRNTCQINEAVLRNRFLRKKPALDHFAVMLPENPREQAKVKHTQDGTSVFAQIMKKKNRDKCQDVALVSSYRGHSLIGVLDGFSNEGDFLPVMVGDNTARLWANNRNEIREPGDLGDLLFYAAKNALKSVNNPFMHGGTTAIIASILPDRRFFIASAGDSAAYLINQDGKVTRFFNHDEIFLPPGYRTKFSEESLDPKIYAYARNILVNSICRNFERADIEIAHGVLGMGSKLVLVSDGITKNLFSLTNEQGHIREVSGSEDIEQIIEGSCDVEGIGSLLMQKAKERARLNITRTIDDEGAGGRVLLPADDDMAVVVFSLE